MKYPCKLDENLSTRSRDIVHMKNHSGNTNANGIWTENNMSPSTSVDIMSREKIVTGAWHIGHGMMWMPAFRWPCYDISVTKYQCKTLLL